MVGFPNGAECLDKGPVTNVVGYLSSALAQDMLPVASVCRRFAVACAMELTHRSKALGAVSLQKANSHIQQLEGGAEAAGQDHARLQTSLEEHSELQSWRLLGSSSSATETGELALARWISLTLRNGLWRKQSLRPLGLWTGYAGRSGAWRTWSASWTGDLSVHRTASCRRTSRRASRRPAASCGSASGCLSLLVNGATIWKCTVPTDSMRLKAAFVHRLQKRFLSLPTAIL